MTCTITFTALGTAMRRGELLGLRWRDVELLEGCLHVPEALVNGKVTTPKSRASRRLIERGPRTTDLLARHFASTPFAGEVARVLCHPELGSPLDPVRLTRGYLNPALVRAGITKPFRAFHDLRHTALTHEAAADNPLVYVQLKAGHSQGQITERYIHAARVLIPGAAAKGGSTDVRADRGTICRVGPRGLLATGAPVWAPHRGPLRCRHPAILAVCDRDNWLRRQKFGKGLPENPCPATQKAPRFAGH